MTILGRVAAAGVLLATLAVARAGDPASLPPGALARLGSASLEHPRSDEPQTILSVAFAASGKELVTLGSEGLLGRFELPSGRLVASARFEAEVEPHATLRLAADGKSLVAAAGCGALLHWDLEARTAREIAVPGIARGAHAPFALSADGQTFAVHTGEAGFDLFEASSGKRLRTVGAKAAPVSLERLVFAPDGSALAWACHEGVRVLDLASDSVRFETGEVSTDLAFSPDGKLVVSNAYEPSGVRVHDRASGKLVATLAGQGVSVSALAFSPDGLVAVGDAAGDGPHAIRLFEATTGKARRWIEHARLVRTIAFAPDARTLAATGSFERGVTLYDPASGAAIGGRSGHGEPVLAAAVSSAGLVATGGADGTLRLWKSDGAPGRVVALEGPVRALALLGDGAGVRAIGAAAGSALFAVPLEGPAEKVEGASDVTALAASRDGKLLATVSGRTVSLFRTEGARFRLERRVDAEQELSAVAVSPDGALVAVGGPRVPPLLVTVATGAIAARAAAGSEPAALAFSPDGKLLASAGAKGVQLLEAADLARAPRALSKEAAEHVAFATAERLAVLGPEGVRLLDVATSETRATVPGEARALAAAGSLLVTGSADGTALVFDRLALEAKGSR